MEKTLEALHFTVEPGFHEKHARSLMLEQNWRGALSFLTSTLKGMPLDTAVSILKGELGLKASGDGVETCTQDPNDLHFTRFVDTYKWQHAGIWQVDAEFYQAYGVVERFGKEDLEFARLEMKIFEDRDYTPNEFRTLRAKYYAERRESDLVHFDAKLGAVLFKRIPGPAFWQETFKEAPEALDAFLKLRNLTSMDQEPYRDEAASDPRHWKFYMPALRMGQLREPRWDEKLLSKSVLNVLDDLLEKQSALCNARWAEEAAKAGQPVEDDEDHPVLAVSDAEAQLESAALRAEIRARAEKQGGFITLVLNDYRDGESRVEVPALPLLWWASRNIRGFQWEDLPNWKPVCPSGMKMPGDNPMHTDWWVGAGFETRGAYWNEHPLNKAAWNFAFHLGESHGCDFVKLAGKGRAFGRIVFPKANETVPEGSIAVVPYAGVDYELAMLSACKGGRGAVISQVGGKLAHLATVARETESRIVVVNDAMTTFKEGEFVTLDLDKMTLKRHQTVFSKDDPDDE